MYPSSKTMPHYWSSTARNTEGLVFILAFAGTAPSGTVLKVIVLNVPCWLLCLHPSAFSSSRWWSRCLRSLFLLLDIPFQTRKAKDFYFWSLALHLHKLGLWLEFDSSEGIHPHWYYVDEMLRRSCFVVIELYWVFRKAYWKAYEFLQGSKSEDILTYRRWQSCLRWCSILLAMRQHLCNAKTHLPRNM